MNTLLQLSKHVREVYTGGNWTTTNLRDTLKDLTWEEANQKTHSFNTIITLVYHTNYYIHAVTKVFEGEALNAKDEYSFDHPEIKSPEDWHQLLKTTFESAEKFAEQIEKLPEAILWEDFTDQKYGNYYRNILGIIEHLHYHLGQIVLIKKIIKET